jgi:hypothetical protein
MRLTQNRGACACLEQPTCAASGANSTVGAMTTLRVGFTSGLQTPRIQRKL